MRIETGDTRWRTAISLSSFPTINISQFYFLILTLDDITSVFIAYMLILLKLQMVTLRSLNCISVSHLPLSSGSQTCMLVIQFPKILAIIIPALDSGSSASFENTVSVTFSHILKSYSYVEYEYISGERARKRERYVISTTSLLLLLHLLSCSWPMSITEACTNKFVLFGFYNTKDQTQGLTHARQVLYYGNTSPF